MQKLFETYREPLQHLLLQRIRRERSKVEPETREAEIRTHAQGAVVLTLE
jgi:hypothetical protein